MEIRSVIQFVVIFLFGVGGGYLLFHQSKREKLNEKLEYAQAIVDESNSTTSYTTNYEPEIVSINFIERNGKFLNPKGTTIKKGEKIYSFFVPGWYPESQKKNKYPEYFSNAKVKGWGDAFVAFSIVNTDTVSDSIFNLVKTVNIYDENSIPEELNSEQEFSIKK